MRDTDLQPLTLPAPIPSAHDLAVVAQLSYRLHWEQADGRRQGWQ
jgi:hypothetical protein